MISDQESFFRKMNVYVIQCDCYVQQVVRIQSEEEWMRYIENLVIEGRSGTDFRPVFQYVEKLRREKKFRRLRALFYFTDGDGIYPEEKPPYETAFFIRQEKNPGIAKQAPPEWIRVIPL